MKKSSKTIDCRVHDIKQNQMFINQKGGGEEIPPGGWRGLGDEIPAGGWRDGGGDEIPAGGWRANFKGGWLTPSSFPKINEKTTVATILSTLKTIDNDVLGSLTDVYRTKIGNGYFKFRFYRFGSYNEIDIVVMPSYYPKSSICQAAHIQPTSHGYKIDPPVIFIQTLSEAKNIATLLCEITMKIIMFGSAFKQYE